MGEAGVGLRYMPGRRHVGVEGGFFWVEGSEHLWAGVAGEEREGAASRVAATSELP